METLSHKDHRQLLNYLPRVKAAPKDWLFVNIRLTDNSDKAFTVAKAARLVHALYGNQEGKLYICNDREILMLIQWGQERPSTEIAHAIQQRLPEGSCDIHVYETTPEGIAKLEMLITYRQPVGLAEMRRVREDNIILVADDDIYMRLLVKKGCGEGVTVHEVSDGKEVVAAYKKYLPDILFLDIYLPHLYGTQALRAIQDIDPKAYVVMMSADSSRENVEFTTRHGAKGFLTKPFSKEKLQDYIQKCPTMTPLIKQS